MSEPNPESIGPSGFTVVHLFSALPSFGLSAFFLLTWISPYAFSETMVSYLMLVMLMEFINVHAAGFMASMIISDLPRGKKALAILGLGVLYTLFVGGFAAMFKQWWPLWAFWGLTANRLLGVMLGKAPSGEEKKMIQYSWAMGVFLYVSLVFLTTLLPIPSFGISGEVIRRQGFTMQGLWVEDPYRVVAFGFLYFAANGLTEVFSYRWPRRKAIARMP